MSNYLVITGASKGIGKTTVALFIKQGWQVINISRSQCDVAGVKQFTIDLSQAGWQQQHSEPLVNAITAADQLCLVHNAAAFAKDHIQTLAVDDYRQILEVNLVAPIVLNQLLLPKMKPGSSIIYMGSTLSEKAVANTASYVISKHGVAGMMKATCQDLAGKGIHTCCICPGFTETEMLLQHIGDDKDVLENVKQMSAAGRLIEPQEIAEVIWFAANHSVINGSVLHANLGQIDR